jgi:hypothetical protein
MRVIDKTSDPVHVVRSERDAYVAISVLALSL